MPSLRLIRSALLVLVTVLAAHEASAQGATVYDVSIRANATRTELQGIADSLEREIPRIGGDRRRAAQADLEVQRRRLTLGDLVPGDRILLRVQPQVQTAESPSPRQDTLVVTPQLTVEIPGVPPITVRGVLFSEVEPFLRRQVLNVIRNVRVTATPLVTIGVLGAVTRPGYFLVPVTASVSEAIMTAGGPLAEADPNGLVMQRGGSERWSRATMAAATQRQVSLGSLGVDDGDVLVLSRVSPPLDRTSTLSVLSFVLQSVLILTQIRN